MDYQKKMYKLDLDKVKTIKDIKLILKKMNLGFTPSDEQDFEDMKKFLKED